MNPHGATAQKPDRIIVHALGEWIRDEKTDQPIYSPQYLSLLGLSAHSMITPHGGNIREREDHQGAYHARGHNTNTLGIEFMVPGVHDLESFYRAIERPYITEQAYLAGKHQIIDWIARWDIKRIERHSDLDPFRKKDPGSAFPWDRLMEDLREWIK